MEKDPRTCGEETLPSSASSPVLTNTRNDSGGGGCITDRTRQLEQQHPQHRGQNDSEASSARLLASWSNSKPFSVSQPREGDKHEEEQAEEGKGKDIDEKKVASTRERGDHVVFYQKSQMEESRRSPNPSSTSSLSSGKNMKKGSSCSSSSNSSSSLDENDVAPSELPLSSSATKSIDRGANDHMTGSTDKAQVVSGNVAALAPADSTKASSATVTSFVSNKSKSPAIQMIKKRKVADSSRLATESVIEAQGNMDTSVSNEKDKINVSRKLSTTTHQTDVASRATSCSKAPIKKRRKLVDDWQHDIPTPPTATGSTNRSAGEEDKFNLTNKAKTACIETDLSSVTASTTDLVSHRSKNQGNVAQVSGKNAPAKPDTSHETPVSPINRDKNGGGGWLNEFYSLMTALTKLVDTKLDGDPTSTLQQVEQLAQTEFNLLTEAQREQLHNDIYGNIGQQKVDNEDVVMHDPATQSIMLQQMEQMIAEYYHLQHQKQPNVPIPATHIAACSSPKFRAAYLQATGNNLQMSTQLVTSYITARSSLFDKGATSVTPCADKNYDNINYYTDLSDNDRWLLHTGYIQFRPSLRDKSKGFILFIHERFFTSSIDWETRFRVMWYVVNKAIQNCKGGYDVQRHGVVQVIYKLVDDDDDDDDGHNNNNNEMSMQLGEEYLSLCNQFLESCVTRKPKFVSCLPVRLRAVHYCCNTPLMSKIFHLSQCSATTFERLRTCHHFGTHKEVQDELSKYGISCVSSSNNSNNTTFTGEDSYLPIDEYGTLEVSRHLAYLEQLKESDYTDLSLQQKQAPGVVATTMSSFSSVATRKSGTAAGSGVGGESSDNGVATTTAIVEGRRREEIAVSASKPNSTATTANAVNIEGANNNYHDNHGDDAANTANSVIIEQEDKQQKRIYKPGPNDVLLGRGKQYQDHTGNVQLVQLVDKYRRRYHASTNNADKTCINQLIVQMIHEKNGRFLERKNKTTKTAGTAKASGKTSTTAAAMSKTKQESKKNQSSDGTEGDNGLAASVGGAGNKDNYWVEVTNDKAWAKVSRYFRQW